MIFTGIWLAGRFRQVEVERTGTVMMAGGPNPVARIFIPATGQRLMVNTGQLQLSLCVRAD